MPGRSRGSRHRGVDALVNQLRPIAGVAADCVLVLAMLGYAAGYVVVLGRGGIYSPAGMLAALTGVGGCLLLSRRYPLPALVLTALLYFVLGHTFNPSDSGPDAADGIFAVIALMIYRLAVRTRPALSATTTILFAAALQFSDLIASADHDVGFNPFLIVGTTGPWVIGLIVRARTSAQDELYARQRELEAEQARYVQESVRYERTRIARELHDIVAHNVSLMVVQASAGHVLATQDPGLVAATFDHIVDSAHQAEIEIDRLIALLDDQAPAAPSNNLTMIEELVHRAGATGLSVTYRLVGALERLDRTVAQIAYRIVQEALTNALKHAPGAPIAVCITAAEAELDIEVHNEPAPADVMLSRLAATGGGHGIDGLRERVTAAGGAIEAGPTSALGWRVAAHLPIR